MDGFSFSFCVRNSEGTRGERGEWEPLDGECEDEMIISYPLRRMEEEPQKTGVRDSRGPNGDDILLDVVIFSRLEEMGRPTGFYRGGRGLIKCYDV